jgi:hypothetical protein
MARRRSTPVRILLLATLAFLLAGCSGSPGPGDEADGPAGAEAESGILTGRLTATGTSNTQAISIATEGHARLAAVLVLVSNLPDTDLSMNVTGPAGRTAEVDTGPLLYALPGTRPAVSFADPEAGDWQAVLTLEGGVAADYEVHWCADSLDSAGPSDNLACQRDYA